MQLIVLADCPYCGQPIGNEQREHIHAAEERQQLDLQVQVEALLAAKTAELEAAKQEAEEDAEKLRAELDSKVNEAVQAKTAQLEAARQQAEADAEKLREELDSKVNEAVQAKTTELEAARQQAEADAEKLREELDSKVSEAVQAKTAQLELARQQAEENTEKLRTDLDAKVNEAVQARTEALEVAAHEAEERLEQIRQEMAAKAANEVAAERKAVETEFLGSVLEKDKKLELLGKKIEELQKQAEGKTAWQLGMQQDELVELLSREFRGDRVTRVPGRSGADVVQEIRYEGRSCGTIVYESKNAQGWATDWIAKLHRDKTEAGATLAILVSVAFPAQKHDFCMIEDIPVVHPRLLTSLVDVIRRGLINLEVQALSFEERGSKLEDLAMYLSSPDFRNKMQSVTRAADKLEALQTKERRALEAIWKDQSLQFRTIRGGATDVDTDVRAIMGRSAGT